MSNRAVVVVRRERDRSERDLDIPLDITLHELIYALYSIYEIELDQRRMGLVYLCAENPIVLMKGNKILKEYGLHDGSIIYLTE